MVSTVLTTNFDQLVLSGMVRAGHLPVICDDLSALNRISTNPKHPQLIEIHGSRHTYVLRNRPEDVEALRNDPAVIGAIRGLLQNVKTFVAVGYAGREDGVMSLLVEAARSFDDKSLYWIQHSNDPKALSDKAKAFLSTTRNGGLMLGQDADVFFLELCKALGVGSPSAVTRPLAAVDAAIGRLRASKIDHSDIAAEVGRAVKLVETARHRLEEITLQIDVTSRLRELRLSGRVSDAYRLVQDQDVQPGDLSRTDPDLLWEMATIVDNYSDISPDIEPITQTELLWGNLSKRSDLDANRRRTAMLYWAQALSELGTRSSESERIKESISVHRELLASLDRPTSPLAWANSQLGLGNALATLGSRQRETTNLLHAVDAYRAALEELTQERFPLDWAGIQNNLGDVLRVLGERQSDTESFTAAVEAFRNALRERTRERSPLEWAGTQNNLGIALTCLGERRNETESLVVAVEAFRAALEEWTRDRVPLDWAMAQNNLGEALASLGERQSGTKTLETAVETFDGALEEWTRGRVPFDWAGVRFNQGKALALLAERTNNTEKWRQAELSVQAALEVYTPETSDFWYRETIDLLEKIRNRRVLTVKPKKRRSRKS